MSPQRHPRPLALWLWYRGDRFRGFQIQPEGPTVQSCLVEALRSLGEKKIPMPAGRTDRGVHARMQVVTFKPRLALGDEEWVEALNRVLPEGVGVCVARQPEARFHAQWSAGGKEYRYRLALGSGLRAECSWRPSEHWRLEGCRIDPAEVDRALKAAIGTRDFYAFHAKSSVRKRRTLEAASLVDRGAGLFEARLSGDAFARNQVRILIGNAVAVAAGALSLEQYQRALETAEPIDGIRAPAEGLTLWEVRYPREVDPFVDDRLAPPRLPTIAPFD